MTDPHNSDLKEEQKRPDPGDEEEAEGAPAHRRPQDQGEGTGGMDTGDRPPAEGER